MALQKRLPEASDLLAAVDAVDRNAKKAGDIVNWIRQQTSPSKPVRETWDLNQVATESLEQRKRQILRARIQVELQLAPNLPLVSMDRIGVEQVIGNLVRNAADALVLQEGERCIWVETRVNAAGNESEATVDVRVRDNGPGLQGRTMDTLCSTFYSTKEKGLGLGLGICRAIAESHGGKLRAQNAAEGGAEFIFTLPLHGTHIQEITL
jgi:two-component system sensor histidine kinase DctS